MQREPKHASIKAWLAATSIVSKIYARAVVGVFGGLLYLDGWGGGGKWGGYREEVEGRVRGWWIRIAAKSGGEERGKRGERGKVKAGMRKWWIRG